MKKILKSLVLSAVAIFVAVGVVSAVANYFNGFEVDTNGWFTDGSTITRVASGNNGIVSADGSYHAEVQAGAYTRWGGYENPFPANGYVTEVDIYLDMVENPTVGTDKRFDFSSAINKPDGSHRRDFIFNVGTDPLVAGQFAMSASNNAPGWPSNPGRDPYFVTQTGWYTFRHTFQDNGSGVLEVVMDVLNNSGTVLHSWTLSDPTDVIGTTVGGNRYGWFVTSAFGTLAIDNSEKINVVVDNEAPDVMIESPADGTILSGTVHVFGTVTDENPHHYWLVIQDSGNVTVAGPGVVNDTNSFTNQDLLTWDTTTVSDGTYTIKLEARDAFNNKDSGSVDWNVVTVNNSPDNKDQCKDGGWMNFYSPIFKNQGDCVSYVQSNENAVGNKTK